MRHVPLRSIRVCVVWSILLLMPLLTAGCETSEDLVPEPVAHTPLPFDPTEEWDIGVWWSNDREMLRLDEVGSYVLFADQNRYHKPVQRGRWSQQSYAVLRLEPYDRLTREWIRVGVSKIDGRIALSILDLEPMFAMDLPPVVAEDGLLGAWTGSTGTLSLGEDRRYRYSPAKSDIEQPIIIAGHDGRWTLDGERLVLTPAPPNMGPFELWVVEDGEAKVLTGPEGEFRPAAGDADDRPIS